VCLDILWKFFFLQCTPRSSLRHSTPFYCLLAHFTLHLLCVLPFKNAMLLLLSSSPLLLLLLGLRFSLCRCFCLCLCLLLCSFGRCFNCFIRRFFFFAAPFGWAGAQAVCAEFEGGTKRVQGPIQCLLLLLLMLLLSLLRRRCSNIIWWLRITIDNPMHKCSSAHRHWLKSILMRTDPDNSVIPKWWQFLLQDLLCHCSSPFPHFFIYVCCTFTK